MHDKTMRAKEMTQFRDVRTDLWTEPLVFLLCLQMHTYV